MDSNYPYRYHFAPQPLPIPSSPDTSPELAREENTPVNGPGSKKPPSSRRAPANRVPRPRNAFMIFRSEFWAGEKISRTVEHDHRHISRIVGHCWNSMSEQEKAVWRQKAEQEKLEHMRQYPDYRFLPSIRIKRPTRRNVKRNGEEEMERCKRVADLLIAGKEGEELEHAINSIVTSTSAADQECANATAEPPAPPRAHRQLTFRGPLLPPSQFPPPRAVPVPYVNQIVYNPYGASTPIMQALPLEPSNEPIKPSNTLFSPSGRHQSGAQYYRPDHARPHIGAQSSDAPNSCYSSQPYSPPRVYTSPYSHPPPGQRPEGCSSTYGQSQGLFQAAPDVPAYPAYTSSRIVFRNPFADNAGPPVRTARHMISGPIGPLDMSPLGSPSTGGAKY